MNCALCNSPLTLGSSECLECGTPISYSLSEKEAIAYVEPVARQPQALSVAPHNHDLSQVTSQISSPDTPHIQRLGPSRRSSFTTGGKKSIFFSVLFLIIIVVGSTLFMYQMQWKKTISSSQPVSSHAGLITPLLGPTATMLSNPYPPYSGALLINDPLRDNSAGSQWMDELQHPNAETRGCHFARGAYHVINESAPHPYMGYCLALDTNFSNFVYQVQVTLLKGSQIGIVFRQRPVYRYYAFLINSDGSYGLSWNEGTESQPLQSGFSSAFHQGLNQPNVLAVVAQGDTLDLYVNKQHLATVTDKKYQKGRIGVAVGSDDGSPSDAAFSNVMLWTLS